MPADSQGVQTFVERRRSPRLPVVVRVEYATVDSLFSEFSQNINEGGVFIETDQPLAVGERVQLSFQLPGSARPIKVAGRVARVATEGVQAPGMGIEFDCLDHEAREAINQLVRELRSS